LYMNRTDSLMPFSMQFLTQYDHKSVAEIRLVLLLVSVGIIPNFEM